MTTSIYTHPRQCPGWRLVFTCIAALFLLSACFDGFDEIEEPYRVGTVTFDPDLPPEPRLPTADEVCFTLEASNKYVRRPDGALPPEADPASAVPGIAADPAVVNPDQERIQAALDECGAMVDAEVGDLIAEANAAAVARQDADGDGQADDELKNIAGVSGEELARPRYRASKYAVRLVRNQGGGPGNAFISGALDLPSGVTLWIDEGVTLYASRDATAYLRPDAAVNGDYCANTAVKGGPGASSMCRSLINGNYIVNSAVVGDGSIDGRAYSEIISTDPYYPLIKVDLTCSNTYAAYEQEDDPTTPDIDERQAPDGTPCDNGGTFVNSGSAARNMTWWDLAYLGNMVQNGITGFGHQSNPRLMVVKYAKNLTLYRITFSNSPNFHVVPSGVDGLTIWGTKVLTPSTAAYANPAGNWNPLYTGDVFNHYNVKNTDSYDPASEKAPGKEALHIGSEARSAEPHHFDGYLKNLVVAYNYISTGDDDIVLKGSKNPKPLSGLPGIDGNMDVRADRKHGIMIAHNHIYWGHGISIGSETNSGVTNVHVYDNSFWGSEEALRIKSDYARGGEVSNIFYENICARDVENALLFTTYYSTRALPDANEPPLVPNFHDIFVKNMLIEGHSMARFEGFEENSGGFLENAHPLVMTLENVMADDPDRITVRSAEARLTLENVNLPILPSKAQRVFVDGEASQAVDPALAVDCSDAFVDFPSPYTWFGSTWSDDFFGGPVNSN